MANPIPESTNPIQIEETNFEAPLSESMLQKIGGLMNYLINKMDSFAVGELIAADLDETQFQTQMGTDWVLCDGRSVSGSRYEEYTGESNIPDARGIFTRAQNNGRSDGVQNPAGQLPLGTYQADEIGSHKHNVVNLTSNLASTTGGTVAHLGVNTGIPNYNAPPNPMTISIDFAGDLETAPFNITENLFIKIN